MLYSLKDLLGSPVPGYYYRTQLTKGSKPVAETFFRVEEILQSKTVRGEKMHFVKFLHYPAKFNRWILESDFLE